MKLINPRRTIFNKKKSKLISDKNTELLFFKPNVKLKHKESLYKHQTLKSFIPIQNGRPLLVLFGAITRAAPGRGTAT